MLYPQILLGFAATVSAIDAYFHLGQNCDGPAAVCTNINPNFCCYVGGSNGIGYRGIPTNWVITIRGFTGGGCDGTPYTETARNTNFVCLKSRFGEPLTGTWYDFSGRKREVATCSDDEQPEGQGCIASRKPDQLVLIDGSTYSLVGLEDEVVDELVGTRARWRKQ